MWCVCSVCNSSNGWCFSFNMFLTSDDYLIFICFSSYTRFHNVLVQYKVSSPMLIYVHYSMTLLLNNKCVAFWQIGSLCMDMIDFELKRNETMRNDLEMRRNPELNGRPRSDSQSRDQSKSADFLYTLMSEEKPRDVCVPLLIALRLNVIYTNITINYRCECACRWSRN